MKKAVRRIIGMSVSATLLTAGAVALRHMLETPQPLKSPLPGEALLYVWRKRSIFYKVLGATDAPPLVLLHTPDIGASAREMQQIMEPLAQTYRVYAPDLLGFGLSDRPGIAYSAATYAELCHDFLRDVVKGPATLVASGLSCNYAVAVASSAPELCAGLVLISPGELHGEQEQPRLLREFVEKPLSKALLYPLLSTRLAFQFTHPHTSKQVDFAQFYATTHQLGAEHAAMALLAGKLVKNTAPEFEELHQPVLLIWGTQALEDQRNRASLHDSKQMHRTREVELIQGAGLAVHQEQPGSVVAAVRRWQAEVGTPLLTGVEPHVQSLAATMQQTTQAGVADSARVLHTRVNMSPLTPAEKAPGETQQAAPARREEPEKSAERSSDTPQTQGILAYCVKCKQKTEMLNASEFTMKNGRAAVRGACAICGTSTNRIGRIN